MDSFDVAFTLAVLLQCLAVFWRLKGWGEESGDSSDNGADVLLVIAHPDDESLFFVPMLRRFPDAHVVCLSSGNYRGRGAQRTVELRRACAQIGLRDPMTQVRVFEDAALQDGPRPNEWDAAHVAAVVAREGEGVFVSFSSMTENFTNSMIFLMNIYIFERKSFGARDTTHLHLRCRRHLGAREPRGHAPRRPRVACTAGPRRQRLGAAHRADAVEIRRPARHGEFDCCISLEEVFSYIRQCTVGCSRRWTYLANADVREYRSRAELARDAGARIAMGLVSQTLRSLLELQLAQ